MKASLPPSPLAVDGAGLATGLQPMQQDGPNQQGFAPLLQQARVRVPNGFAVAPSATMDGGSLVQQLQSLPQAGKLLPLLRQVLNSANANGVNPRQLLERLTARLEDLQSNPDANPTATLIGTLHQLLDEMPALQLAAAANPGAVVNAASKTPLVARLGEWTDGRPARPALLQTEIYAAVDKARVNGAQGDFNATALTQTDLDEAVAQDQQRQTQSASVMTALRRLTVPGKSATSEALLRAESAAGVMATTTAQPSTPALPTLSVTTPLGQAGWDQALGERIQWMVNRQVQGAQIKLNPAQLGPLEVRVQVHNDQASIQFSSAHGVVREALEAALPRLRDMFDASGVELVEVDVSGQSFAGGQRTRGEDGSVAGETRRTDTGAGEEAAVEVPLSPLLAGGRLDLFA